MFTKYISNIRPLLSLSRRINSLPSITTHLIGNHENDVGRISFTYHKSFSPPLHYYTRHNSSSQSSASVAKGSASSASLEKTKQQLQNNDLADHHIKQKENRNEFGDLLNELGLSVSKWHRQDENKYHLQHRGDSNVFTTLSKERRQRKVRSVKDPYLESNNNFPIQETDLDISSRLKVYSVHAAETFDLVAVATKVFRGSRVVSDNQNHPMKHVFGRTNVIFQFPPLVNENNNEHQQFRKTEQKEDPTFQYFNSGDQNVRSETRFSGGNDSDSLSSRHGTKYSTLQHLQQRQRQPRYIAVFRFGSVVFFNISTSQANSFLKKIKEHGINPTSHDFERKESFEVVISPFMEETAHVNADFATVKDLNINCVAVISSIIAQSVALDSYNDTVDELLATFATINSTVKKTGNFTDMERESLFKVVAQNNSLFIDMIAKLGIKDRSYTAWNLSQYERVHEGMKDEFEIESRFSQIEFKLNLIQQNAKFFLEILHSQKSNTLEWIIIVLITFECALMILEMSGIGNSMLAIPSNLFVESPPK